MSTRRSPRAARLARSEPQPETDALAPESAPVTSADEREALLRELDSIIKSDGPDPAKVSAISLKAKLLGLGDPSPAEGDGEETEAEPATPRELARAVLAVLRESSAAAANGGDVAFYRRRPGYRLIEVPDREAPFVGGSEPINVPEADRKPTYSPDGAEIRVGSYTIAFGERSVQGRSRPICEWTVTDSAGTVRGRRHTSEEAIAFAKALPEN